jgi:hypothetical protein
MAGFANGFSGDVVSLNYILKTLDAKSYIIPGVTSNPDITVTAQGESAYYYKRSTAGVTEAKTGAQITWDSAKSKGVTRVTIDMADCFQIADILPRINVQAVSADVVGDKVVQDTITVANDWNKKYIAKLVAGGTAKTYADTLTVDNIYKVVVGAKADFIKDHKDDYMRPTAVFVAPDVMALLKEKNLVLFKDNMPNKSEKIEGYFDEMAVIEAPDLDAGKFIIMNALGAGSPLNIDSLFVTDATQAGFPGGTLVSGELGYGLEICDATLVHVYSKA